MGARNKNFHSKFFMPNIPAISNALDLPIISIRGGAPADVRYFNFLKLVNADRIEKITFSADVQVCGGMEEEASGGAD